MDGDVPYWLEPYEATMKQCANDCINTDKCKSFSHSISENMCKLMIERKPTGNGLYEKQGLYGHYQYCMRGNFKIILVMDMLQKWKV